MDDIEHKLLEQTLKNDINLLSIKIDNNDEKIHAKIDDVISPMVKTYFTKHDELKTKVENIDSRVNALEIKDSKKEADQMKSLKKWILGIIGTGLGGYVLLNIDKILKLLNGGN